MVLRSRQPRLTRMPGIASLATTGHFRRDMPVVSAGLRSETVSSSATPPSEPRHGETGEGQLVELENDIRTSTVTSKLLTCEHQQSHAIAYGRLIPVCIRTGCGLQGSSFNSPTPAPRPAMHISANLTTGAGALVQTMQGFPYDLRRSRVEASRLMGLSPEDEDFSKSQDSFKQRQLTLLRSNAGRSRTRRVG